MTPQRAIPTAVSLPAPHPAEGDPDSGIAPGTAFEDLPDDWCCPVCGVGKVDFVPYED